MNSPRIALTDLDGTLLRPDRTVSTYTVEVLTAWVEAGNVLSFATARSAVGALPMVNAIPWRSPLVVYDGALLYDPLSHRHLASQCLDADTINQVLHDYPLTHSEPLLFALDAEGRERVLHTPLRLPGPQAFRNTRGDDPRFLEVAELYCPAGWQVLKLLFIGAGTELTALHRDIHAQLGNRIHSHLMHDLYLDGDYTLDISHPHANKHHGTLAWAAHLARTADEIIAFGDNLNDMGLFSAVGTRVAMGNAVDALKARADVVIGTNEEDAVARYLAALM
ncbi:MAG: HAD hydrolase family protein [Burkholderiales bacterium]|nr:HAD hydrolase family protein [Burkholderiales bacterium]